MNKPHITQGLYKHYKGAVYEVFDVVLHTETNDWLVLYKAHSYSCTDETGNEVVFVRPYEMFMEYVIVSGKEVPRFEYIS